MARRRLRRRPAPAPKAQPSAATAPAPTPAEPPWLFERSGPAFGMDRQLAHGIPKLLEEIEKKDIRPQPPLTRTWYGCALDACTLPADGESQLCWQHETTLYTAWQRSQRANEKQCERLMDHHYGELGDLQAGRDAIRELPAITCGDPAADRIFGDREERETKDQIRQNRRWGRMANFYY